MMKQKEFMSLYIKYIISNWYQSFYNSTLVEDQRVATGVAMTYICFLSGK